MAKGGRKPQTRVVDTVRGSGSKFSEVKRQIEEVCADESDENQQGKSRSSSSQLDDQGACAEACDGVRVLNEVAGVIVNGVLSRSGGRHVELSGVNGARAGKDEAAVESKSPWVDSISDNRLLSKGLQMKYSPPMIVDGVPKVEIEPADTKREKDYWSSGLILFAAGMDLSMNSVKQFMEKVWKFVSMPELYFHEDGYFIARFSKPEEREAVMAKGPYTIYSAPLFLRKWSKGFVKSDELMRLMPIWCTFPKYRVRGGNASRVIV